MTLSGLLLHSSRCGSTLVLRALGAWPGVVTVDEPPALDVALTEARRSGDVRPVRAVLADLGAAGEHVVVKTDAWHVMALPLLLAAAPGTPWLFVHRDPAEILASHARQPGSHTVPGVLDEVWFGPPGGVHPLPHAAEVLSAIFTAAAEHAQGENLVDHAALPEAIRGVARRLGLEPDAVLEGSLAEILAQHSKHPHERYVDDRAAKRGAVTDEMAVLVATRLAPAYRRLLALGSAA